MKAAMAAGNAVARITVRRPKRSESGPKTSAPSIGVSPQSPRTKPVSPMVSPFAARKADAVQDAELKKTEPPKNSATASRTTARLKRAEEGSFFSIRIGLTCRIVAPWTSAIKKPNAPTVRNAADQCARVRIQLVITAPAEPRRPYETDTRLAPNPRRSGKRSDISASLVSVSYGLGVS